MDAPAFSCQKAVLETLIIQADDEALRTLDLEAPDWKDYFAVTQ